MWGEKRIKEKTNQAGKIEVRWSVKISISLWLLFGCWQSGYFKEKMNDTGTGTRRTKIFRVRERQEVRGGWKGRGDDVSVLRAVSLPAAWGGCALQVTHLGGNGQASQGIPIQNVSASIVNHDVRLEFIQSSLHMGVHLLQVLAVLCAPLQLHFAFYGTWGTTEQALLNKQGIALRENAQFR